MLASNCQQTTITTGTGDLTLASTPVLGFQLLSNQLWDTTNSTGIEAAYWLYNGDRTEIECGVGALSALNTFVRDTTPEYTLFGGVSGSGSKVNFSAGTKYLIISPGGRGLLVPATTINTSAAANERLETSAFAVGTASTSSLTNASVFYVPFYHSVKDSVDAVWLRNTVAGTGNVIMGIYSRSPSTGRPSRLYKSGVAVSNAVVGPVFSTLTATGLSVGWHYLALHKQNADGTQEAAVGTALRAGVQTPLGIDGSFNQIIGFTQTLAYSGVLPAAVGALSNITTGNAPFLGLRIS